ncbi:unnamed protein product [Blepharisma stoltei]|uniref:Uncharacterized protein n=1 Tax=Blepharisma stoltei TaxID=1481888 RepID=A0AAU9JAT7_9CILI|nr:unnamed protein product [Blepharisma stoltei]
MQKSRSYQTDSSRLAFDSRLELIEEAKLLGMILISRLMCCQLLINLAKILQMSIQWKLKKLIQARAEKTLFFIL